MRALREYETEEIATIGKYTIYRTDDGERDTFHVHYSDGATAGSIPFSSEEEARHYCLKRQPKPLWQMEVRQKLDLSPDRCDPVSRLLFAALYQAQDEDDFSNLVQNHCDELQKSLAIVRSGGQ